MRYPHFAAALRQYGTIREVQRQLGIRSQSQVITYRAGRALPKAEKFLAHPDLVAAARQDVMDQTPVAPGMHDPDADQERNERAFPTKEHPCPFAHHPLPQP
ncbi:MAG: hypothetical protein WCG26_11555 [Chloroflexales bacterium]